MSLLAVSVENVSKRYRLGSIDRSLFFKELRAKIGSAISGRSTHSKFDGEANASEFWALQGIDLQIREGETIGIIGRNGAGKSTLLKILSRITAPTTGRIRLKGRVGSLLEVGTGFHAELTGRDNAFLYGTIMGMKRGEIRDKFDEIVAFAELEKFIDTPVKRYSSGMYVRLAFSVAAFLEPEILIVDEALAVGDAQFQAKCMQRISQIIADGRTLLFVSHAADAVRKTCKRCVYLKQGRMVFDGPTEEVLARYEAAASSGQP